MEKPLVPTRILPQGAKVVTREEYHSVLRRLPIDNPTEQDMAALCPHLIPAEAIRAFTTGDGYVACPPLLVRHGFQVVSYHGIFVEKIEVWRVVDGKETRVVVGTKKHPPRLNWAFARRTRKSYADGKSHGDIFSSLKCDKKAMAFAETHWGDDLMLDDWVDVTEFYVQDPTDLTTDHPLRKYPRTKAVLHIALSRDFDDITNDRSKPESELFDEAIMHLTTDRLIAAELEGGRSAGGEFNCAHCGAGLSLGCCHGCGHTFDDDHSRSGWDTPLSKKMVAFLRENGHQFAVDPSIAWQQERERWEESRALRASKRR